MYTIHEPSGPLILYSEKDFEVFRKDKIIIEAAGGLVFNKSGQLLLMQRRGSWDLPKGKLDPGESLEECALREVSEETGLTNLKLIQFLKTTYHTYPYQNKTALKPSHWYRIEFQGEELAIPQQEEDITEIRWVNKNEAEMLIENAFGSIREMILQFFLADPNS